MTKQLLLTASLSLVVSTLLSLVASAEELHTYVSKVQKPDEMTSKSGLIVEFNEKWSYSPSKKQWTNARGEAMSADELLSNGKITLRPANSLRKKEIVPAVHLVSAPASPNLPSNQSVKKQKPSPFVYVWDETKSNKIRIMCTGFGTYHRGLKR